MAKLDLEPGEQELGAITLLSRQDVAVGRSVGDRGCIERLPDGAATAIIDQGGDDPRAARADSEPYVDS